MPTHNDRTLSREVTATQIPSGDKTPLPVGTRITISQTLGGNFTVATDFGLFRIDAKDGDALGEAVVDTSVKTAPLASIHRQDSWPAKVTNRNPTTNATMAPVSQITESRPMIAPRCFFGIHSVSRAVAIG